MLKYPVFSLLIVSTSQLPFLIGVVRDILRGHMQSAAADIKWWVSLIVTWTLISTFVVATISIPADTAQSVSTFETGDFILVRKTDYFVRNPERGELVWFRSPSLGALVSRVIGLPGETVRLESGTIWINDKPLPENYVTIRPNYRYSVRLPADSYFLLPDRRAMPQCCEPVVSIVRRRDVIGCLWLRFWPLKRIGLVPRPSYPKER